TVDMNPILIKPSSDTGAQVVVCGRVWGQVTARDYHQHRVEELFPLVLESYHRLAASHDIIVIEGAGSPAEINLKAHDIVNMRMADAADAACLLVGDIDRGGVFASLLGTMALLDHRERRRVRGFVINKFRGDPDLLTPGIAMIERRLRLPCLGVILHLPALSLDDEDNAAAVELRAVDCRTVVGIYGWLQIVEQQVRDPAGAEGGGVATGLGFCQIVTELRATKTTVSPSVSWTYLELFGQTMGAMEAGGY